MVCVAFQARRMDSTLLTPNDGAQKPQRSNHEDIQLHWFRRRSSLCTRAVVESIRTGQVCVLKDTLAAIGKKARTDELDEYGFALLHHAARSDSTEALRALLDCGANIDVRDLEDGLTPLHVAARCVPVLLNYIPLLSLQCAFLLTGSLNAR